MLILDGVDGLIVVFGICLWLLVDAGEGVGGCSMLFGLFDGLLHPLFDNGRISHERAPGKIKYIHRKYRHRKTPASAFTKNFRDRSPWHQTCVHNWFDMPGCDEQMPYYDYCFYCFKAVSPLQGCYRDHWPLFTNSSLSLYF